MARTMDSREIQEFLQNKKTQEKIDKFNSGEKMIEGLSYNDLVEISNRLDCLEQNYLTFKDKLNDLIMN
jgi:hypothetical protein